MALFYKTCHHESKICNEQREEKEEKITCPFERNEWVNQKRQTWSSWATLLSRKGQHSSQHWVSCQCQNKCTYYQSRGRFISLQLAMPFRNRSLGSFFKFRIRMQLWDLGSSWLQNDLRNEDYDRVRNHLDRQSWKAQQALMNQWSKSELGMSFTSRYRGSILHSQRLCWRKYVLPKTHN